jgi:outer membrane protein assembly factor BamB
MNATALRARYATCVWSSAIAAGFTLACAALMLTNFVLRVPDPLTTPVFLKLKEQLRASPDDEACKQQIRAVDLELRHDFFRRREFTRLGTMMLLGGLVIAIGAAKTAALLRRRLPQPVPRGDSAEIERKESRQSIAGIAVLCAIGAALGIALNLQWQSSPLRDLKKVAAAMPVKPKTTPKVDTAPKPTVPVLTKPQPSEKPEENAPSVAEPSKTAHPGPVTPAPTTPNPTTPNPTTPNPTTPAPVAAPAAKPAVDSPDSWPRFRGPGGSGIAKVPVTCTAWDVPSGKGVIWKTPVPLPGNSSPVVWGDAVFLTGADETQRAVYCFDAEKGTLRWTWTLPAGENAAEPPEVTEDTGLAAPTAATDGTRIFAMFANGDLGAADFSGKQVWLRRFGNPKNTYGHATSLAVGDGKLILQFDQGNKTQKLSKLMAFNPESGETIWETPRETPNSWSTPAVTEHEGKWIAVTCGDPWVIGYSLQDGKELWRVKCLRQDVGPSPVVAGGLVFAANEFPGMSVIKLGGQGDVTSTHVAWFTDNGVPDTCSPLVVGDLVLLQASFGTLTCYDAEKGGDALWQEEFNENIRSSPALAGDHVYLFFETGKSWVVKPGRDKCERVSENDLGEGCVTSPAIVGGRIYIRGKENLICLGEKK